MNTLTQPVSLKVSRHIKASRERVFTAWTTPADLIKWLGGPDCNIVSVKMDLRVGGTYTFVVNKSCDGNEECCGMTGQYREINSPSRLVFTWSPLKAENSGEGPDTLVTVDLTEENGGTLVTITHEGFANSELCDLHNIGWTASLEKLEKLV